ncbi:hypothetical protein RCH10_003977 [Variovorax sp. GrIS 2.14]
MDRTSLALKKATNEVRSRTIAESCGPVPSVALSDPEAAPNAPSLSDA